MVGIKNTDKILELKKVAFREAVKRAAESRGKPSPKINFEGELCPGYGGHEWAHIHVGMYLICVPINMLQRMTAFELEDTATHEVTHIFDLSHDASFHKEHYVTKISSLKLPPGVTLSYEGMHRPDINPEEPKIPDETRCNHPTCRRELKLTQCPHCDYHYCIEHIQTFEPGKADIRSTDSKERERAIERNFIEGEGHACAGYVTFKEKEKEKWLESYQKFLDRHKVVYIAPAPKCEHEKCGKKLRGKEEGHQCDLCGGLFCKKHTSPEIHTCPLYEPGAPEEPKHLTEDKKPTDEKPKDRPGCKICDTRFKKKNKEYVCIHCKDSFCIYHKEPEKHDCIAYTPPPLEPIEPEPAVPEEVPLTQQLRVFYDHHLWPLGKRAFNLTKAVVKYSALALALLMLIYPQPLIDYSPESVAGLVTKFDEIRTSTIESFKEGNNPVPTPSIPQPTTTTTTTTRTHPTIPPIPERNYTIITIYDPITKKNLDGEIHIERSYYGETDDGKIRVYFSDIPDKEQKNQYIESKILVVFEGYRGGNPMTAEWYRTKSELTSLNLTLELGKK